MGWQATEEERRFLAQLVTHLTIPKNHADRADVTPLFQQSLRRSSHIVLTTFFASVLLLHRRVATHALVPPIAVVDEQLL